MAAAALAEVMRAAVAGCASGVDAAGVDVNAAAFSRAAEHLADAFRAADERRRCAECEGVDTVRRENAALVAELERQSRLLASHRERLERWSAECVRCRALALASYPGAPAFGRPAAEASPAAAVKGAGEEAAPGSSRSGELHG